MLFVCQSVAELPRFIRDRRKKNRISTGQGLCPYYKTEYDTKVTREVFLEAIVLLAAQHRHMSHFAHFMVAFLCLNSLGRMPLGSVIYDACVLHRMLIGQRSVWSKCRPFSLLAVQGLQSKVSVPWVI